MKYMIRVISASFYDENDYSMEFGKFQFWSNAFEPKDFSASIPNSSGTDRTAKFRTIFRYNGPDQRKNEL